MAVKLPEFRPVILDARPQDVIDSFNICLLYTSDAADE